MRPDLVNVNKVLDRMEEIARRCGSLSDPSLNPERARSPEAALKSRFVDLLNAEDEKKKTARKKQTDGRASVDELRDQISRASDRYNIDEELIRAVIQVESGWNTKAVSSKGARGLMQLMPRTAEMLGVEDSFDPEQNIEGGVKYLSRLTDKYGGDVEKALAAYNAGPSRVDAAGGAPFPETARYVENIMNLYHRYREED